jgi:cupin fold WbuC family metalloprotein
MSAKHRARICAHPDVSDAVHEMVICLLDKCYIRPHRHRKAESLHVIEGTCDLILLDAGGNVSKVIDISSDLPEASRYVRLAPETFHTLLIRSEYFLFHETTRGPLDPADTVFGDWSPPEGSTECAAYVRRLNEDVHRFKQSRA